MSWRKFHWGAVVRREMSSTKDKVHQNTHNAETERQIQQPVFKRFYIQFQNERLNK